MKPVLLSLLLWLPSLMLPPMSVCAQTLLPQPRHMQSVRGHFRIGRGYRLTTEGIPPQALPLPLREALALGRCQVDPAPAPRRTVLVRLTSALPAEGSEAGGVAQAAESYTLRITPDTLLVQANSQLGLLRAGQTLSQLTTPGSAQGTEEPAIPCCQIQDSPAFAWRGAMIDVSRHFQPVSFLRRQVDLMARYKLNRLHLHLTDAAGWRMPVDAYPRLTELAAWRTDSLWLTWWSQGRDTGRRYVDTATPYSPPADTPCALRSSSCIMHHASCIEKAPYGGHYTKDELRELVRYAAQRGIEIIPEIEMPAHSEEVLVAYPELSCTHQPYLQADFCPGNEETFRFLETVLTEVMEVFPSPVIHIGGDEAGRASWGDCPLCRQRMREQGLTTTAQLQGYLMARIGRFLQEHGRTLAAWDELLDPSIQLPAHPSPADTARALGTADTARSGLGTTATARPAAAGLAPSVVMLWRAGAEQPELSPLARRADSLGAKAVWCPGEALYLDFTQDAPPGEPLSIGGYTPLDTVYAFCPPSGAYGLQGNLWTEYVPTAAHAERMLWPRLLAVAQRGWLGAAAPPWGDFRQRALEECRSLAGQGVAVFPLWNEQGERPQARRPLTSGENLALGRPVHYLRPWHDYYPGAGASTLTDGLRGGWRNKSTRWQGFIGPGGRPSLSVVTDLGRERSLQEISLDFFSSPGAEIYPPASFTVRISSDSIQWQTVCDEHHSVDTSLRPVSVERRAWRAPEGDCPTARYIHVEAASGPKGGWLFTDEIVVR